MMRVLFAGGGTGGHLYPALALGTALRKERPGAEVHYVGAIRGVESRVLPARGEPHTLLPFEPIRRSEPWRNWRLLPAMVRSLAALRRLFQRFRPDLVVGTGGYASGPACAYAMLRRVPVAIQEQNSYPGLTTRWLSRGARQVHLGFPEAGAYLHPGPRTEVFDSGNPIVPPAPIDRSAARAEFGLRPDGHVVLVVGGSQGALAINEALLAAVRAAQAGELSSPPADLQLLWATGPAHIGMVERGLADAAVGDWVRPVAYIDEMPKALAAADVAISRAGAMATAELLAWRIPSILIPLPTAAADHQTHNARALAEAGAAVWIAQADLTPALLWRRLLELVGDDARRAEMARRAGERARPDAARDIVRHLIELVESR
ncbi:MAG TPA: undecaprenyldiphospho-muramoylpentapeptide beta-N-acetylglucosaminyltransferase [Longimicrobiales bacterium]|nr:undecaprenyldiphospho-muramoylpentapeptide beta-N-acetylglucosaminyltransferase [Longimicrobiales bacterium]